MGECGSQSKGVQRASEREDSLSRAYVFLNFCGFALGSTLLASDLCSQAGVPGKHLPNVTPTSLWHTPTFPFLQWFVGNGTMVSLGVWSCSSLVRLPRWPCFNIWPSLYSLSVFNISWLMTKMMTEVTKFWYMASIWYKGSLRNERRSNESSESEIGPVWYG